MEYDEQQEEARIRHEEIQRGLEEMKAALRAEVEVARRQAKEETEKLSNSETSWQKTKKEEEQRKQERP